MEDEVIDMSVQHPEGRPAVVWVRCPSERHAARLRERLPVQQQGVQVRMSLDSALPSAARTSVVPPISEGTADKSSVPASLQTPENSIHLRLCTPRDGNELLRWTEGRLDDNAVSNYLALKPLSETEIVVYFASPQDARKANEQLSTLRDRGQVVERRLELVRVPNNVLKLSNIPFSVILSTVPTTKDPNDRNGFVKVVMEVLLYREIARVATVQSIELMDEVRGGLTDAVVTFTSAEGMQHCLKNGISLKDDAGNVYAKLGVKEHEI